MAAIAAISIPMLTSCSDDDNENPVPPCIETEITEGVFLVNSGNSGNQIPGSLTYISKDGGSTLNAFATANGRVLGNTPNDVIVYGSKLYIAVTGENTLEVVDKTTMKSIKQISTTELMGEDKGKSPRRLLSDGGHVYLSTFDGYVAAIDTTNFAATDIYQAGSYPEGMAIADGVLYVANSDYGNGEKPSISRIDLKSKTSTEIKDDNINNPTALAVVDGTLYILDYGSYDASWNQVGAGVYKYDGNSVTKVTDATMMAVDNNRALIYTVNAPYSSTPEPVDIKTGTTQTFITGEDVFSPAAITVDPTNGDVYIASYNKNSDTGYADYAENGYVNRYTLEGIFARKYETGVGPTAFAVNISNANLR